MIGTTGIFKRLAVGQLMLMLLVAANGAGAIRTIGVVSGDTQITDRTGAGMVGAIGVFFRMPAGYIVRVPLIVTDGAEAILAVGVAFIDPLSAT